jgi:hypothetical protein
LLIEQIRRQMRTKEKQNRRENNMKILVINCSKFRQYTYCQYTLCSFILTLNRGGIYWKYGKNVFIYDH